MFLYRCCRAAVEALTQPGPHTFTPPSPSRSGRWVNAGQPDLLGPLGPRRVLDPTDTAVLLALLRQHTTVVEVTR